MSSRPPTTRTPDEILHALSWPEKLAQLQILFRVDRDENRALARSGIGALFWPRDAAETNELQRIAMEESPHGIPLLIGLDVIHGHHTIFPTPLAQAASFDPAIAEHDARVSAIEASSGGVNWTFSPMVDTSRDPRWGRVVEGFGESAMVNARFGAAKVRGYQGDDLAASGTIASCLKHFVAYGAVEAGRDYNTTDVSRRRLRELYLAPFRAGIRAGAASVMASFTSLNGTPMHAHRELLTDVLSTEWGFDGVVVGDADGVSQLVPHGIAPDEQTAAAISLASGLDVVMGGPAPGDAPLVAPDAVTADRVDAAVLRVLRLKQRLGLFDNPYVDANAAAIAPSDASLATAQRAAERCIVLAKNDGNLLPLDDEPRRALLVGPYAESTDHLGAWVQSFAARAGSLADALRTRFDRTDWTVLPGADFLADSAGAVAAAVAAAPAHDVVVVAVGEPSDLTGEARSRSDIRLPGDQERLITELAATGVPVAVLLTAGRPLVVEEWVDDVDALVVTWHLGTRGPQAIARALAGDIDPGGRIPMSFPRAVGQIPVHHDHERTGRPALTGGSMGGAVDVATTGPDNLGDAFSSKHIDLPLGPRFAFGHGLSYASFALADVGADRGRVAVAALLDGATVRVSATVTNTSERDGEDVVFVYLADPIASVTQPVRRLVAFERVSLSPGGSQTVSVVLGGDDLGFWNDRDEYVLEPGALTLIVEDGWTTAELPLEVA